MKNSEVLLVATDVKDSKPVKFEISRALKLLTIKNSKWALKDSNYEFNGKDLIQTTKK